MNNPMIGELADRLNGMEDSGLAGTPAYEVIKARYEALKALPESWPDVRAKNWTPAQRALAVDAGMCGECGRSECGHRAP